MGLDAETGVFMLLFLDLAYDEAKAKGRLRWMAIYLLWRWHTEVRHTAAAVPEP